jgi:4-hydroxybenzoyl-CoA thioesterase
MLKAVLRIRVEWSHCDPARIIFNPNYYIWMDHGAHALMEAAGFPFLKLVAGPNFRGLPLVASNAEFLSPARLGDRLELWSEVERFGTKSMTMVHEFSRDGVAIARGREVRVWAGASPADDPEKLVAIPIPDDVREMLSRDGTVDMTA